MGNNSDNNQNIQQFGQIESNSDPMSHLRTRPNFPKSTTAPYIPEKPKKSKTPIIILLIILFAILVVCGGFCLGMFS